MNTNKKFNRNGLEILPSIEWVCSVKFYNFKSNFITLQPASSGCSSVWKWHGNLMNCKFWKILCVLNCYYKLEVLEKIIWISVSKSSTKELFIIYFFLLTYRKNSPFETFPSIGFNLRNFYSPRSSSCFIHTYLNVVRL